VQITLEGRLHAVDLAKIARTTKTRTRTRTRGGGEHPIARHDHGENARHDHGGDTNADLKRGDTNADSKRTGKENVNARYEHGPENTSGGLQVK
jgi:hypothetical protein